jgi:hypothetical protein
MDQKEDLISQHDTLKKKAYDEAIAQTSLYSRVKGETYLAYAKYRLEYYQTLINLKTKEVKDIDMGFQKRIRVMITLQRLRTNK